MRRLALFVALVFLALPVGAVADTIDFNIVAPTSGSISYAGGDAPLVGSDISVDSVVGLGTPLNSGVTFNLIGGDLDFTTGANTGGWTWDAGGAITINGTVDVDGSTTVNAGDITGTLLSGTFLSAEVTPVSATTLKVAVGLFTDTKHEDLLALFGIAPPGPGNGLLNISFLVATAVASPNAFASSSVLSGDVVNTSELSAGSLLMLGLGLIGFVRRKFTEG